MDENLTMNFGFQKIPHFQKNLYIQNWHGRPDDALVSGLPEGKSLGKLDNVSKIKSFDVEIISGQAAAGKNSLSFILQQKSSKSVYKQKSCLKYNISRSKPRNNISEITNRSQVSEDSFVFSVKACSDSQKIPNYSN